MALRCCDPLSLAKRRHRRVGSSNLARPGGLMRCRMDQGSFDWILGVLVTLLSVLWVSGGEEFIERDFPSIVLFTS